ncbi:hypothetical protein BCV69DRAFT_275005 [Microstroma glucosiphilum]|uniref:Uncharacterized protein n=1 Tax=Pseudomicrostroma glucosiphilum TaxID=1684307 RepID=A0A316UE25_9BASI|nr:hypothetical protein BCV69DRAFT_275005 [Pseudomicrostroma glucosiphilum]PWN23460.1 hypothetical protein BCV69DRAFT_275005 [Pseudomicrostroma glucosiphilum]
MRLISTLVLLFGCVALAVTATTASTTSLPAAGPPPGLGTPPSNFDRRPSSPPYRYVKMYRRTTGYVKPVPSAPPLPSKGTWQRTFRMHRLPPGLQKKISEDYGKKRKWGRMTNGS